MASETLQRTVAVTNMLLTGNLEQLSDIGNMKTIGILGGMSAASTLVYYRRLCDLHREANGGLASPDLLIRSVDFSAIEQMQRAADGNQRTQPLGQRIVTLSIWLRSPNPKWTTGSSFPMNPRAKVR